eukprot:TRINITY_DN23611_c0_g1_i1.p1 TRINITY_DN23611_c0_g1~~TRINITY_DN23611_c0_g1_i1.p1  ORF type:complete len:295 (+),score=56.44 TRINITY_DN23611_c0_g1_i1:64-948(+)
MACSFGKPPDPSRPQQVYPGVSTTKFDPAAANRCWLQAIRKEKESRSVHQLLDAYGKLGLPEEWAKTRRPFDESMPGQSSVACAYKMLGWKKTANGRVFAPEKRAAKIASKYAVRPASGEVDVPPQASVVEASDTCSTFAPPSRGDSLADGVHPSSYLVACAQAAAGNAQGKMPVQVDKERTRSRGPRRREKVMEFVRDEIARQVQEIVAGAPSLPAQNKPASKTAGAGASRSAASLAPRTACALSVSQRNAAARAARAERMRRRASAPALATAARAAAASRARAFEGVDARVA